MREKEEVDMLPYRPHQEIEYTILILAATGIGLVLMGAGIAIGVAIVAKPVLDAISQLLRDILDEMRSRRANEVPSDCDGFDKAFEDLGMAMIPADPINPDPIAAQVECWRRENPNAPKEITEAAVWLIMQEIKGAKNEKKDSTSSTTEEPK